LTSENGAEDRMLDDLLPDLRMLLELTRRIENFDATILACSIHGQPIKVTPDELDERHEMMTRASRIKAKWGI
jgi:hypothetical protein